MQYLLNSENSKVESQNLSHSCSSYSYIHFLGSLIVRPFLPENNEDSAACGYSYDSAAELMKNKTIDIANDIIEDVPDITKPFLIIAIAHVATGLAFVFLSKLCLSF
jgi:hypothetical protein